MHLYGLLRTVLPGPEHCCSLLTRLYNSSALPRSVRAPESFGSSPGLSGPGLRICRPPGSPCQPGGGASRGRTRDQAARARTGGPQSSAVEGSSKQLGQTRTSRTISEPTPPGSSVVLERPSFMKWWAFSRKGYLRRRVSTTFRWDGVLAGTTTSQTWHRYNRNSLPLRFQGRLNSLEDWVEASW